MLKITLGDITKTEADAIVNAANISFLGGSGCKNCHALLESTKEAVKAMGLDIEVGSDVGNKQDILICRGETVS